MEHFEGVVAGLKQFEVALAVPQQVEERPSV